MIFVDSCVWIDFFCGVTTPAVELLDKQTGQTRFITGDLVLAEVLQGFQIEAEFHNARKIMLRFSIFTVSDMHIALTAAQNFRLLRSKGVTPRKTIDTLIATRCIRDDLALLTSDRDFQPFFEHLGLRDAMVEA